MTQASNSKLINIMFELGAHITLIEETTIYYISKSDIKNKVKY